MAWTFDKYYDVNDEPDCQDDTRLYIYLIANSDLPDNATVDEVIDELQMVGVQWAFMMDEVRTYADKAYGDGTGLKKSGNAWVIKRSPFQLQFNHKARRFASIDERDLFISRLHSRGYYRW